MQFENRHFHLTRANVRAAIRLLSPCQTDSKSQHKHTISNCVQACTSFRALWPTITFKYVLPHHHSALVPPGLSTQTTLLIFEPIIARSTVSRGPCAPCRSFSPPDRVVLLRSCVSAAKRPCQLRGHGKFHGLMMIRPLDYDSGDTFRSHCHAFAVHPVPWSDLQDKLALPILYCECTHTESQDWFDV